MDPCSQIALNWTKSVRRGRDVASLALASAYYALARHGLIAVTVVGVTVFGVITFETFLVRHLTRLFYILLIALAAFLATTEPARPKLLMAAVFAYFLSFSFAARVTLLMMMRNDRAYRAALYPALRITFSRQDLT